MSQQPAPTFGQQLTQARRTAGLRQEQLANMLNVSRSTISHWENDHAQPSLDQLQQLCELVPLSITKLPAAPEASAAPKSPAAPAYSRYWLRLAVLLAAMILVAAATTVLILNLLDSVPEPYSIAWFQQRTKPAAGHAHVVLTPSHDPVPVIEHNAFMGGRGWFFSLYLDEVNGVDIDLTELIIADFSTDGRLLPLQFPSAELLDHIVPAQDGHRWLHAHEQLIFRTGLPLQDLKGRGFLLKGVDATGEELTFRCYVQYDHP